MTYYIQIFYEKNGATVLILTFKNTCGWNE